MIKVALFEYWKKMELEQGRRITVAEVVRETGLQRNTIQGLLDGETTRFDSSVLDAICRYFAVPAGEIPFLEYVPDHPERSNGTG